MPTPPEFNIEGKVFVVVGAGRGIGRGIAEVLAEAGCDGVLAAVTPTYVIAAAERIAKATGRRVTGVVADGTSTAAMDALVQQVLREYGTIDIWVNSVGDSLYASLVPLPQPDGSMKPEASLSDEEFRRILDINLTSIHAGSRAIAPYFIERRQGRIINIGSFFQRRGGAHLSTYTAAKMGVEGLTRSLALEWAPFGITVNCIAAGSFPDPETLEPAVTAERREQAKTRIPVPRVGELREVGLLTLYMASEAGSYMTGQTVGLDGGIAL